VSSILFGNVNPTKHGNTFGTNPIFLCIFARNFAEKLIKTDSTRHFGRKTTLNSNLK